MTREARAVLVTGGSRGLGLALVGDLLARGYRVGTCSRQSSAKLDALLREPAHAGRLFWQGATVGDAGSEARLFEAFAEWAGDGAFYGLVNNAAIAGEGILATFPNVDSERIIETNLVGALRLARAALRLLLKRPGPGRIVNVSSIIGLRGYVGLAAYSASKAGLDGLTRALAREVGRRGITVNSVNPGYLESQMSASLSQSQRQQIARRTPLERLGRVEDVVPVVRFLLSDEAAFITGQSVVVDGGISC